jgi:hypothetical protein
MIWGKVLTHLTSPKLRWSPPVAKSFREPQDAEVWWTSNSTNALFCTQTTSGQTSYYAGTQPARYMQANKRYLPISHLHQHIMPTHYATMIPATPNGVTIHSISPIKRITILSKCMKRVDTEVHRALAVMDHNTGELLNYRTLLRQPEYHNDWTTSSANEFG